jgi:uncharacterized protein YciI
MTDISCFIYLLRPTRPNFIEGISKEEEVILGEHFHYLEKALAEGTLVLADPCLDGVFGVVIFKAASQEEAEGFMDNDPAVKHGFMRAEVHPFHVSLMLK